MGNETREILGSLEAVRSTLLEGRISDVSVLVERLSAAEASLSREGMNRADLEAIVDLARRVASLIEESRKGVASALETIANARSPVPEFSPYGADGRRVSSPRASSTRRA